MVHDLDYENMERVDDMEDEMVGRLRSRDNVHLGGASDGGESPKLKVLLRSLLPSNDMSSTPALPSLLVTGTANDTFFVAEKDKYMMMVGKYTAPPVPTRLVSTVIFILMNIRAHVVA